MNRHVGPQAAPDAFAPASSFEELEIRTRDGAALRAEVFEPPPGTALRGTCVMAHALFARRSEFGRRGRAGLANAFAEVGWRTITFDFRGHGESDAPRGWGYDDLVRWDLPAVVSCARARSEDKSVIVLGHSLGGHVALASQGTARLEADAIVAVAATMWLREFEPSSLRWVAKRWLSRGVRAHGGRLGLGNVAASSRLVSDLARFVCEQQWRSADGRDDYLGSLPRVTVPVCAVVSEGDRFMCPPGSANLVARRCSGPVEVVRITRSDDGAPAPGHMEIVTTPRARSKLLGALRWVDATLPRVS